MFLIVASPYSGAVVKEKFESCVQKKIEKLKFFPQNPKVFLDTNFFIIPLYALPIQSARNATSSNPL